MVTASRGLAGWISAFIALTAGALAVGACSTSTLTIGNEASDGGNVSQFAASDASKPDAESVRAGACPTTECPPGRATCPTNPFPCGVDFKTDNLNCGGCGIECPILLHVDASTSCVDGTCVMRCEGTYADCNGYGEDGCETNIGYGDSENCGGCGIVCPALHECKNHECVCKNSQSCGACGNICPPPDPSLPELKPEWHAEYSCANNLCNQPVCKRDWDDCNNDFRPPTGDGCETYTANDVNNCGACGVECAPGEVCTSGECVCPCGSVCFTKIEYDPKNCGACNVTCRDIPNSNSNPVCDHGVCDYRCFTSHADCDHDLGNGCETNILSDPLNCGACGHRCDAIEGQACVDGECTTKECIVQ